MGYVTLAPAGRFSGLRYVNNQQLSCSIVETLNPNQIASVRFRLCYTELLADMSNNRAHQETQLTYLCGL